MIFRFLFSFLPLTLMYFLFPSWWCKLMSLSVIYPIYANKLDWLMGYLHVLADKPSQRHTITPDIFTQRCIHLLNITAWGRVKTYTPQENARRRFSVSALHCSTALDIQSSAWPSSQGIAVQELISIIISLTFSL